MDAFEITERLKTVERERAKLGRIDWYNRNVPGWLKNLRDLLADPVWDEGELNDYCLEQIGRSEAQTREFLNLPGGEQEFIIPPISRAIEEVNRRAMTSAEKQRAYRERKKAEFQEQAEKEALREARKAEK